MKAVKISALGVVALAIIGFVAFEWFFRSAAPSYTGDLALPGLQAEVEVRTDE